MTRWTVMIFIGFGFLMTYLKKYGYSSVGLNFLVAALVIQWSILSNAFWHQAFGLAPWHKVELVIETLITADFAAGAVLITFGAVLGKVTPAQLMLIALIEVCVYGINESIGAGIFGAVDMGGSIFVHTFGAYFGLACSLGLGLAYTRMNDKIGQLSKPTLCCGAAKRDKITAEHDEANHENEATKESDMFAMIGTLFLWMFWPSFNGALATESQQHRVVINTLLSLCACCISAFIFSTLLRGIARHIGGDVRFCIHVVRNPLNLKRSCQRSNWCARF
jgi:ammonium transporter Rh